MIGLHDIIYFHQIEKYRELGVETIEKNDLKKNIFEVLIGSNVANILWVLGVSAVIRPIIIAPELIFILVKKVSTCPGLKSGVWGDCGDRSYVHPKNY